MVYVATRLLLTVLLAVLVWFAARLIELQMPWLVAAMIGIVTQLPIAWLVFGSLRDRATRAAASTGSRRRAERDRLRAELAGADSTAQADDRSQDGR